jgi:4-amino-4-deoxychorismate lyase
VPSSLPSVLINGQLTLSAGSLSVLDRGLQYGDGLFETILVEDGHCHYWAEHLGRLELGCRKLGIQFPGRALLSEEVTFLIQSSSKGVLKLIITRGVSERGYRVDPSVSPNRIATLNSLPTYPESYYQEGIRLVLCQQRLGHNPQLAGVKHLNRLEQVMARREWHEEYQEGVLLDQFDQIAEGTMSNLFILKGNILRTPVLDGCGVHGIIRDQVIQHASAQGVNVKLENFGVEQLLDADVIFLTNSIIGVWPVRSFEEKFWESHRLIPGLRNSLGFPS